MLLQGPPEVATAVDNLEAHLVGWPEDKLIAQAVLALVLSGCHKAWADRKIQCGQEGQAVQHEGTSGTRARSNLQAELPAWKILKANCQVRDFTTLGDHFSSQVQDMPCVRQKDLQSRWCSSRQLPCIESLSPAYVEAIQLQRSRCGYECFGCITQWVGLNLMGGPAVSR